jgi:hypothetical protein
MLVAFTRHIFISLSLENVLRLLRPNEDRLFQNILQHFARKLQII